MTNKKLKLLAPCRDWNTLKTAVEKGADEIYFGIGSLNLRNISSNKGFSINQLDKIVKYCHDNNVLVNVTLNSIIYESEISKLKKTIKELKKANVDIVIAWDYSVLFFLEQEKINFCISTQASISNFSSIQFLKSHFKYLKRVVLARELDFSEIISIKKQIDKNKLEVELEGFCHGAMCVAYSGRCFMSKYLYSQSANRGKCIQPCRREYKIIDKETNKELIVENNFIMSPKDLNTIKFVDKLAEVFDVIKIEGRMKSSDYNYFVVDSYRKAIDLFYDDKLSDLKKEELFSQLECAYNKYFSDGFYNGLSPDGDFTNLYGNASKLTKVFLGDIKKLYKKINVIETDLSNDLSITDELYIDSKKNGFLKVTIIDMKDSLGNCKSAKRKTNLGIKIDLDLSNVSIKDKLFKFVESNRIK